MRGRAHALVKEFFERFSSAEHSFVRAGFILKMQMPPEDIGPDLDDPAIETSVAKAIEELSSEIKRLRATGGSRGGSSTTLKPLKRST